MTELMKPRFHGNGFIQVYLSHDTRLHIWTPEFPATRVQNAQYHDHRFWFTSTVLKGKLLHAEAPVKIELGGHGLWQQGAKFSDKSTPLEFVSECEMGIPEVSIISEGETYLFGGPNRFHQTASANGEAVVTLMRKIETAPRYRARMVCLGGGTPDHAFENQPDQADLRAEVNRLLGGLF